MSNEAVATTQQTGIKQVSTFLNSDAIKKKFAEVIGNNAPSFIASVLSACNSNNDLKNATTESIYSAALMAATLNLPINPNLGFAYLIPYKSKAGTPQEKVECQFQIGYKGFKQLAQRTGQYLLITEAIVYEGHLVSENPLTGFLFDWNAKKSDKVIGYVSYFKLLNGFESTFYMSTEKMTSHAGKYSQTFKSKTQWVKESSKWTTDYDAMSLKTVTKLNLSKNGPLSIEMQKAMITDQSVIHDVDSEDVSYPDNTIEIKETVAQQSQNVETDRIKDAISKMTKAMTPIDISAMESICKEDEELMALFTEKRKSLGI